MSERKSNNEGGAAPYAIRNQTDIPDLVRLTALGYSGRAIAGIVNRDPHTIYKLMETEEFQNGLAELRKDADKKVLEFRERLAVASEAALDRIIGLSEDTGTQENIKLSANKAIIEYSGRATPTSKRSEGDFTFRFESEALERLTDAMRELAGVQPKEIIDVPATAQ